MSKDILRIIDYSNCITNLTSSIQKYYHLKPNYKCNAIVDSYLSKKEYQNVIVMVFDAMGTAILNKNTSKNHYLQKKCVSSFKSTYPPTTANCTTAYLSGKNPIETGWLGWSTYFKVIDQCIDNFTNADSLTHEPFLEFNVADTYIPFVQLGNQIEDLNEDVQYYSLWPDFKENGCSNLKELTKRLIDLCNQDGKKYIYVYWDQPDGIMHSIGTKNDEVKAILNDIAKLLKEFERKTKNSIAFVSADHGQIDVIEIPLYTYFDLYSCLKIVPSIDSRTPNFFIKDGKKEEFVSLFNKYFSDKFLLLTHDEVLSSSIFGEGTPHPMFDSMVGDYVGIAIDKYYFSYSPLKYHFKGHHAGLSEDEMTVPLIVVESNSKE